MWNRKRFVQANAFLYLYGSQIWRKPTSFMTFGELKLDFFLYNKENSVVSSLILKFN